MTEKLEKMDAVFSATKDQRDIGAADAVALIGSTIRKAATDDSLTLADVRATMQRAYLLTKQVEAWIASETEDDSETLSVPTALLEAVEKDADWPDAAAVPLSEAMQSVGKRLKGEPSPVAKGQETPEPWQDDLAADEPAERVDWGRDPDFSAVE